MIGYLEGQLLDKAPNQILVKVGGVGYRVFIPLSTFYALPEPPAAVALQIHTRMQEDALHLYGFNTLEEKDLFLQLLSIPRVGARTALNILSGINPEDFAQALLASDDKRLAGIPGIGKKSAARIVLELKDKLPPARRPRPASAGEKLHGGRPLGPDQPGVFQKPGGESPGRGQGPRRRDHRRPAAPEPEVPGEVRISPTKPHFAIQIIHSTIRLG